MLVLYHLFVLVLIQEGTRAWGGVVPGLCPAVPPLVSVYLNPKEVQLHT